MPLNHGTPDFGDYNYPAMKLGVLKAVNVTCSTSGLGTAAHGLGRVPNVVIPVGISSTNGSIVGTSIQLNATGCLTAPYYADATNVYVVAFATGATGVVFVG